MRKSALLTAVLLFSPAMYAQITAGEVPPGQFAYDPNVDLGLSTIFSTDSGGLELDCDDAIDGWAQLSFGYPAVDAPNSAGLHFYANEVEVCMDLASGAQQRPKYHVFGELIDCTGDQTWQPVDQVVLGDFGGFLATGPIAVDSLYIAYRQGGIPGWIQVSFDLSDDVEIDLQVHSVLSVCGGSNSIRPHADRPAVVLYPNPSNGGPVHVESTATFRRIELLDVSGRTIAELSGASQVIEPPDAPGTYLVRLFETGDQSRILRLVKY